MSDIRAHSQEYEHAVCLTSIVNKSFRDYVRGFIVPDYFQNQYFKELFRATMEMQEGVNWISLAEHLKLDHTLSDVILMKLLSIIERFKEYPQQDYSSYLESCRGRVTHEVTRKRIEGAMVNAAVAYREENFNAVFMAISNLKAECELNEEVPVKFWESVDAVDTEEDVLPWEPGIELGIHGMVDGLPKLVDNYLDYAGVGRGHLVIIQASKKVGKSALLNNIALFQCFTGLRVLFYSLELDIGYSLKRLYSLITQQRTADLKLMPKSDLKMLLNLAKHEHSTDGDIEYFQYPAGVITPGRIEMDLASRRSRHELPDVVFVDYLALMKAGRHFDSRREQLSHIAVELRRLAKEFNVVFITATQSNRQAEKEGSSSHNISEDYSALMTCDLHLVLNKQATETQRGKVWNYFLTIDNNRYGESGVVLHLHDADMAIGRLFKIEPRK